MKNMPGIRPFRFTKLRHLPVHAYIVLVSHERSANRASNPWEDSVDIPTGRITYWGDAKWDAKRTLDDFPGNRALRAAYDLVLDNSRGLVPPILHFSKPKPGVVKFNGLCALERLELTWFEDRGRPVRNYRAQLAVLDEEYVDVDWLHERAEADNATKLESGGPEAWRHYQAGLLNRLHVWAPKIRTLEAQLPAEGSKDASVLAKVVDLEPFIFERAVVSLFQELEIVHAVEQTRLTADGGFDFFGSFTLPPPLEYEIDFRGEVKRFSRSSAVRPKDVSRLVARLSRGQYGLFVTTSYFTRQAQEEVFVDRYPTKLFSGADVLKMMKDLGVVRQGDLSERWLQALQTGSAASIN